jgi:hypothetical protein
MGVMEKFPRAWLLAYIRDHPNASVASFSREFLGGLSIHTKTGTERAYAAVYQRLR